MADEYISRAEYIEKLQKKYEYLPKEMFFPGMKAALELARTIPTADVAPVRHGRWRFDDFDGDGLDYQCSWCRGYQRKASDYCPNCGAKMDEEV